MNGLLPILLQAAAAQAAAPEPAAPPVIEIRARVEAERVEIERAGEIDLELRADPGVTEIDVDRSAPAGRQSYTDLRIDIRARAWIGEEGAPARAPTPGPAASATEPQQGTDP